MNAEQQQNQQYDDDAGQTDRFGTDPLAGSTTPDSSAQPSSSAPGSSVPPVSPAAAAPAAGGRPRFRLPRLPRLKIRAALIALGLVVAGILAAVYFSYWQNPARVLGKAVTKTASAQSLHYEGSLKVQGELDKESKEKFSSDIAFRGDYDGQKSDNPKLTLALGGKVDLGKSIGKYEGELEGRYLDKTFYGALTKAPKNDFIDLEGFTNLWAKFPEEKTEDKPLSDYAKPLSKEENKRLEAALKKHKVVSKLMTEKDEQVDGVPSRHYKATLDYKQLKELAPDVASILLRKPLDEKEKQEIRDSITEPKTNTPIDVWVSKRDGTVRKVFSHDEVSAPGDAAYAVSADSTLLFSKINQPVTIKAPEKSLTAEQLEKESTNDTDKDGLVDLAERYFKTNPKNPDSDGDKFKDGTEAARGFDPAGPGKLSDQEKSLYGLLVPPTDAANPEPPQSRNPVLET